MRPRPSPLPQFICLPDRIYIACGLLTLYPTLVLHLDLGFGILQSAAFSRLMLFSPR